MYNCVSAPLFELKKVNSDKAVRPDCMLDSLKFASNPCVDTVSFRGQKEIYLDKLNKLFPEGIEKTYNSINDDFGIDIRPELKLYGDNDGVVAGGFTFEKNEISMSLSDLLGSDTKIVGIKNGKRTVLVSPSVKLPLFIDNKSAKEFVELHSKHGNLGFDELVVEPVTEDEQRKFIAQKLAHEVIHAQQHMIMRRTEGIGEKEVIKAWTHQKPKNLIEEKILDYRTLDNYNKSYWSKQPETKKTITSNSPQGKLAKVWLEAIRNYPPVNSSEYKTNAIEVDAYMRSASYVDSKYGPWS